MSRSKFMNGKTGCGTGIGKSKSCSKGDLCDVCLTEYGYIDELEQENQRLRKALEHYADKEEWIERFPSSPWKLLFNSRDVDGDGWEVARRALKDD